MEVQAELSVNANPKVVVHDKDLGGVLVGVGRVGVVGDGHLGLVLLLLIGMEDHRPPDPQTGKGGYKAPTDFKFVRGVWNLRTNTPPPPPPPSSPTHLLTSSLPPSKIYALIFSSSFGPLSSACNHITTTTPAPIHPFTPFSFALSLFSSPLSPPHPHPFHLLFSNMVI